MNAAEERDRILSRFHEGSKLLEETVGGLQDSELDLRPSGGGWSIRQIVHHVVDGDDIWHFGIKKAIGNEQAEFSLGWYSSLAQDTWADRWAYSQRPIGPSLSLLKAIREHLVQLVAIVPDAWTRAVVVRTQRGEFEQISVGAVIQMQTDHLVHHVERIRAILREGAAQRQKSGVSLTTP